MFNIKGNVGPADRFFLRFFFAIFQNRIRVKHEKGKIKMSLYISQPEIFSQNVSNIILTPFLKNYFETLFGWIHILIK